jgi:GntR family transcriptional regulator
LLVDCRSAREIWAVANLWESMLTDPKLVNPNIPLNEQMYVLLRNEILDGLWAGKDSFPGEQELAAQYGVSVITSKRVLKRLEADRLIERGRGRRTQVIGGATSSRQPGPAIFPLGKRTFSYKVVGSGVGVGWAEACEAFGLPHGSQLWHLKRLRMFEKRPHSVSYNAQLPALGETHAKSDLSKLPMGDILRRAGQTPARLIRRNSVSLPPIDVAQNLRISLQDPTLVYTFTLQDPKGVAIEWVRIYVHPEEPSPDEVIDFATGQFILSQTP